MVAIIQGTNNKPGATSRLIDVFNQLENLDGTYKIGISGKPNLSISLKNITYQEIYSELDKTNSYNIKMMDGALIQLLYQFKNDELVSHRLAFFPCPMLEEFQNNPNIYIEDDVYAEVLDKNIVAFPIRFDFDESDVKFVEMSHPKSHLTLGQYKNCRIPVSAPLTPYYFVHFILRNFYNTAFTKYSEQLIQYNESFRRTISNAEQSILNIQVPT